MNAPYAIDWHARAASLTIDGRLLTQGRRLAATHGETFAQWVARADEDALRGADALAVAG